MGGGGGGKAIWRIVLTSEKILATPLNTVFQVGIKISAVSGLHYRSFKLVFLNWLLIIGAKALIYW